LATQVVLKNAQFMLKVLAIRGKLEHHINQIITPYFTSQPSLWITFFPGSPAAMTNA
jgi:hypothetical protein